LKKLDIEASEDYLEAENTIKYLLVLKEYYTSDSNFDQLELGDISLRELFRFMSDNGFPKKGFIQDKDRQDLINKIDEEIQSIRGDLKKARLTEIKDKELNSILIIPSWNKVIGYETKGFYLNKPVLELRRDTIVMLSYDIIQVTDKFGTELALLTGPGILYTEFSLAPGSYVMDQREINVILLPVELLSKLLEAPPIFQSDIDATMNELIAIIPFSLIEEAVTIQAILRGVISRNIFHPNKEAIDRFIKELETPSSFNPNEGYKILSAHEKYFNRLLLTQAPPKASGDSSINRASAGIAAILLNGQIIMDELFPDKEKQSNMLLSFKDIKNEFNKTGRKLIEDWMP
jgi:hypothetical protein